MPDQRKKEWQELQPSGFDPREYRQKCSLCGIRNHFARVCQTKDRRSGKNYNRVDLIHENTQPENEREETSEDYFFLGNCELSGEVGSCEGFVNLGFDQNIVKFKVDTGADVSIMNFKSYKNLKNCELLKSEKILKTPNGILDVCGMIKYPVKYLDKTYLEEFHILVPKYDSYNLLSKNASVAMGIVKFSNSIIEDKKLFGFGKWDTTPIKFHFKNNVMPYSLKTARNIAIPLHEPVKTAINKMVSQDIIEAVSEPTEWASPMVPIRKPNGEVRITVDYRQLNRGLKRERFLIPTFDELVHKLKNVKYFSKLDASSGFFQIPLHESAMNFTCFLTPFGRFRFKRLPMGINIAPEIYQRKMNELLGDLEGVLIYMDDILIYAESEEKHDLILGSVFKILLESGLKLNKDKCVFKTESVKFLGHTISKDGISIDPSKIRAIEQLSPPKNLKELQRFLGMVNFLTKFVPKAQITLSPLNELLKKNTAYIWDHAQQSAFEAIKHRLCNAPLLGYFDPSKPTIVSADASSFGMGGVLLQKQNDKLVPIAYCSRAFSAIEKQYAQIERELLAGVFACEKFNSYLCGLEFELQTDHKPLVPLINQKNITESPIRCQRLLLRLARYSPRATYIPGKYMVVADTLSRGNFSKPDKNDIEREVHCYSVGIMNLINVSEHQLKIIYENQQRDPVLKSVFSYTLSGWPEEMSTEMKEYYAVRGELSVYNMILVYRNRLVVPKNMQNDMLRRIHEGHFSLSKCRNRAQLSVWWPGISGDLKIFINQCSFCQTYSRNNKAEPIKSTCLPERPWQKLGMDLFELGGKTYFLVVDYFSRWIEIQHLIRTDSESVIDSLKTLFARFGIPDCIRSDGGPQFISKYFRSFVDNLLIKHEITSPYFSQANGCAERAVQTAKRIMRSSDSYLALLAYRNTPLETTGCTPAQLLMGRHLKTTLPVVPSVLLPKWPDLEKVRATDAALKLKSVNNFNRIKGARPLPELDPNESVRIKLPKHKEWSEPSSLIGKITPNSYVIRNRKFLKPVPEYNPQTNQPVVAEKLGDPVGGVPRDDDEAHDSVELPNPEENLSFPNSFPGYVTRSGRISRPVDRYGY